MDTPDYTPSIGRKLKIQYYFTLTYSLILLGLGIFLLVRYNIYSDSDYPECQYGDLKTNTYIIAITNLVIGFIFAYSSILSLAATRNWAQGNITTNDYIHDFYHEHNSLIKIILFVLQFSVICFASSNVFRLFVPCRCDPYLYYTILVNVDIFYNIVLIGIGVYVVGYLLLSLLYGLFKIIRGYFQSCCGDCLLRYISNFPSNFGLFNRGRVSNRPEITVITSLSGGILPNTNRDVFRSNTNYGATVITIPRILPELLEFAKPDDCVVCIEQKKIGVKFVNCSHWVCEVCWSQLMNTNPVCPLCRAKII